MCRLACGGGWSPGPHCRSLQPALFRCQAKTAMASLPATPAAFSGGFSTRVVRDRPLAFSHLEYFSPTTQLWSARLPRLVGNPPTAIHLPVKSGVRATLRQKLVLKAGLMAGTVGIFGRLDSYLITRSPLFVEVSSRTPDGEVQRVTQRLLFRKVPLNFGI